MYWYPEKIPHRFNKIKKEAGKDFISAFMEKHHFSCRKPEATSVAQLMVFNKKNVDAFFPIYKELREKYSFRPNQIYNVDETCSTVPTETPEVPSPTGSRRVSKISSAERESNVSVACCVSATDHFILPFFIYPRIRMQPAYIEGAPMDSVGVGHESEWMNAESFVKWLEHFITHARPSETNSILLLMGNHTSHVTLNAVNLCQQNHIIMLGFSPHTSHCIQPLDVSFYGPLKTAYSQACSDFLTSHPGQTIGLKDIAKLFGITFAIAASSNNAIKGFQPTGIEPLILKSLMKTTLHHQKRQIMNKLRRVLMLVKLFLIYQHHLPCLGHHPVKDMQQLAGTSGLPPMPYTASKERRK